MSRVVSVIVLTSLPASSGAASIAHSEKCALCSASVRSGCCGPSDMVGWPVTKTFQGMPTTNMSGSPTCAKPSDEPLRDVTVAAVVNAWLTPWSPSCHRAASPHAGTRSFPSRLTSAICDQSYSEPADGSFELLGLMLY